MRYVLLACVTGITLGAVLDFDVLLGTPDDFAEPFGPDDTVMPASAAERALRTLHARVHRFIRALVDDFTASYGARVHRPLPTEPVLP